MNASDLPVFGAQLWYTGPGALSGPEDLGVILPGQQADARQQAFDHTDDALARTILTFRDAPSRRWVRLPNGDLKKQTRDTTRDSILALLTGTGHADQQQENIPGE